MAVQTSVRIGTNITNPVFVKAEINGEQGHFQIRSLTHDDALCAKVVHFLEEHAFEFYRNGQRYTHENAVSTVKLLRDRFEAGNPFSGFALLDDEKVVGFFRVGFDDDPRKIQIAGMGEDTYQNQGIGQIVLGWILKEYLPMLHANGYRLPVFDSSGKNIHEWMDLNRTSVVALVHPDYTHCNHLLAKVGFRFVKQIKKEDFSGVHDGRRNVYEIALKRFIKS